MTILTAHLCTHVSLQCSAVVAHHNDAFATHPTVLTLTAVLAFSVDVDDVLTLALIVLLVDEFVMLSLEFELGNTLGDVS